MSVRAKTYVHALTDKTQIPVIVEITSTFKVDSHLSCNGES